MIPDGLEPSLSGCRPEVVAAGPRDHEKVAGAGIEPTSRRSERRILPLNDPALGNKFTELRGQESNHQPKPPTDEGGKRLRAIVEYCVQSDGFLPAETTPQFGEGRVGLEPTRWCLTNTCSAAELPTQ